MLKPVTILACVSLSIGGIWAANLFWHAADSSFRTKPSAVALLKAGEAHPRRHAKSRGRHRSKPLELEGNEAEYIQLKRLCDAGDAESCKQIETGGDETADVPTLPGISAPARQLEDDYIDPGALGAALSFAQSNAACSRGDRKACARINSGGLEGRRLLVRMKLGLKQACELHHMDACVHRAEIEFAETSFDSARVWFTKAKELATQTKSRCVARRERNQDVCARADAVIAKVATREEEIAKQAGVAH